MKARIMTVLLVALAALLLASAGCSKKKIDAGQGAGGSDAYAAGRSGTEGDLAGGQGSGLNKFGKGDDAARKARLRDRLASDPEFRKAVDDITERIYFDYDSNTIRADAQPILRKKADLLKRYNDVNIVVEGHCDSRGTSEYNLALGERRARSAYEYMIQLGVSPERMSIVSFGSEKPLSPGSGEDAYSKNRRDEFTVDF
jgi:peptidoglycan-associated lipoprotein